MLHDPARIEEKPFFTLLDIFMISSSHCPPFFYSSVLTLPFANDPKMRLFSLILLLLFCQSTSGFTTSGKSFNGRTTFRRNGNVLKSGSGEEGGMPLEVKDKPSVTSNNGLSTGPASVFGNPISAETKKFNKAMIDFIKGTVFDTFYKNQDDDRQRDYARFYALETIARTPYFAYLSVLHLYETLGRWRRANYLKLHFAESWK